MANIAQISTLTGRGAGLLTDMIINAPLLSVAEFQQEASDHLIATSTESSDSSGVRNEGDVVARRAAVPDTNARKLRIFSRQVAVDNLRIQDARVGVQAPLGLRNFYDSQLRIEAIAIAEEFQNQAFIGTDATDVNGKLHMLGFSELVKDAAAAGQTSRFGFTTAEIAAMNVQVALQLNTADNQNVFVELLTSVMADVPGANALLMNTLLAARMTTIGKRLGAAGEDVTTFGTRVDTFNRVPIIPLPTSALPQTETDGINNNCGSLYVVRFAEQTGAAFTTNSGFIFTDFPQNADLPSGIAQLEMFVNLAVMKRNAVRRLSRIRL